MNKLTKKGQITVFLIIGVLALFLTATFLLVKEEKEEKEAEIDTTKIRVFTEEQDPMRFFIQNCVKQTAIQGFDILGLQGGYIDIPDDFVVNPNEPTESDVLTFNTEIPYWYYLKSRNEDKQNIRFSSKKPSIETIQREINKYVEREIDICFNEFQSIKNLGYEVDILDEAKATTLIREDDVIVLLRYPIEYFKGGSATEVNEFYAEIEFDFMEIYKLASELTEKEVTYAYLEDFTKTLIRGARGYDSTFNLPPMYGSRVRSTPIFWIQSQVKNFLEELLVVNFPYIRVPFTLNGGIETDVNIEITDPHSRITQALADNSVRSFNILENDYQIAANILYLGWPSYLRISGAESDDEILGPTNRFGADAGILQQLSLSNLLDEYDYSYDVSYPVLIELEDPFAFNGRGYRFYFALESNIRSNNAITEGTTFFLEETRPSLACRPSNLKSGDITIITSDGASNEPLADAQVSYSCGDFYSCNLGLTKKTEENAEFTGKFPLGCSSGAGILTITKPSYLGKSRSLDVAWEENDTVEVSLMPIIEIDAKVMKRTESDLNAIRNWAQFRTPGETAEQTLLRIVRERKTELEPEEQVFLVIERVQGEGEQEYQTILTVTEEDNAGTISLVPGRYILSAQIFLNKPVTLTQHVEGYDCSWYEELLGCDDIEDQDIVQEFSSILLGGAEINFTVGDNFYENNDITFFVLTPKDIPADFDEFVEIANIETYSLQNKRAARPVFG